MRQRNSVDFPAPDPPTIARHSPREIVRLMSDKSTCRPIRADRLSSLRSSVSSLGKCQVRGHEIGFRRMDSVTIHFAVSDRNLGLVEDRDQRQVCIDNFLDAILFDFADEGAGEASKIRAAWFQRDD